MFVKLILYNIFKTRYISKFIFYNLAFFATMVKEKCRVVAKTMQKNWGKVQQKVVDKCMQKLNNWGAKISRFGARATGGGAVGKDMGGMRM